MRSQLHKKIILAWVLLFSAVTYINAENFIHEIPEASSDKAVSLRQKKYPGSKLEHSHFQLTVSAHTVIKKNPGPMHPFQVIHSFKQILSGNIQIKRSALLVKKYLAFIFPYHYFW